MARSFSTKGFASPAPFSRLHEILPRWHSFQLPFAISLSLAIDRCGFAQVSKDEHSSSAGGRVRLGWARLLQTVRSLLNNVMIAFAALRKLRDPGTQGLQPRIMRTYVECSPFMYPDPFPDKEQEDTTFNTLPHVWTMSETRPGRGYIDHASEKDQAGLNSRALSNRAPHLTATSSNWVLAAFSSLDRA